MSGNRYQLVANDSAREVSHPAPFFLQHPTIYSVMSQYLNLMDLAQLAATSHLGRTRLMNLLNNQPELFLSALLKLPKLQIAAFLRKFPFNLEIIQNLYHRLPNNPAAFTLWAMTTNVSVDPTRLAVCMQHFEDVGNSRAFALLQSKQRMAQLTHYFSVHPGGALKINQSMLRDCCYGNYAGVRLVNLVGANNAYLHFENIDFSGVDFRGAYFENVIFKDCNFTGADLSHAQFVHVEFLGMNNFTDANLSFADLSTVRFHHTYNRGFIFTRTLFEGAHFFTREVMSFNQLFSRLQEMPFAYLRPDKAHMILEKANYLAMYMFVTSDLINVVSNYSEEAYGLFRQRFDFPFHLDVNTTLKQYQYLLLEYALHENNFFNKHYTTFMWSLNDFLQFGVAEKNPIYTPAQKVLRTALNRFRHPDQEDAPGCFRSLFRH